MFQVNISNTMLSCNNTLLSPTKIIPTPIPPDTRTYTVERYRNRSDCQWRGCITSTPKTADFREKWLFLRKYERDSCIPFSKNGERPYPEPPKRPFWGPGFLGFRPSFYPSPPVFFSRLKQRL